MAEYKRIHLRITDLPISSAKRVFQFLDDFLLDDKLNVVKFKSKLSDFVIGERYFIVKYSLKYFDYYNPKSYLKVWISEKEKSMVDFDKFSLEKYEIKHNADKLAAYCNNLLPTLKRRFTHTLINYPFQHNFDLNIETVEISEISRRMITTRADKKISNSDLQHSIRIPIIVKLVPNKQSQSVDLLDSTDALLCFKNVFSVLLSSDEVEQLARNTLRNSKSDNSLLPLKYLYIDIEDKGHLYECIYRFYKFYKEHTKSALISKANQERRQLEHDIQRLKEKLKADKKKYTESQINDIVKKTKQQRAQSLKLRNKFLYSSTNYTKYDFLCAFYFSFPVIRESYFKAKSKTPSLYLPNYLNIESRNLKMRKKSN